MAIDVVKNGLGPQLSRSSSGVVRDRLCACRQASPTAAFPLRDTNCRWRTRVAWKHGPRQLAPASVVQFLSVGPFIFVGFFIDGGNSAPVRNSA